MKLLTFLAERFAYKTFSKTLDEVADQDVQEEVHEAVVVFMQVEAEDQDEGRQASVFRQTLKHIKWLANKRSLRNVVLHSFTHLGGQNADADFAWEILKRLDQRLTASGYRVWITPYGYFCSWELSVYGESLAKVFKQI